MFTSRVMVIKMSKRFIFVFSADDSKTSVSERSYLALSENAMDYWVLSYISKISALENILFLFFLFFCFCFGWLSSFFDISMSRTVTTKPINYAIFWKNSKIFHVHFNIFSLLIPSYRFREGNLEELDKQASKCYIQHHWQVLLLFSFVLLFFGGFFHFIF